METNNIDKIISEKFKNRTFTPSKSAWERLSFQLEEQTKTNKKSWFFYAGIAASVLILLAIGFQFLKVDEQKIVPQKDIVTSPKEEFKIENKIDNLHQNTVNEVVVENITQTKQIKKSTNIKELDKIDQHHKQIELIAKNENESHITAIIKDNSELLINKASNQNHKIKINADDLLFAVTHNAEELKKYYTQHQINRDDLLQTIENELKKSNVKVNPETILAEVERNISEDDFQNNFLQFLKKRVSDIAVVIATRND